MTEILLDSLLDSVKTMPVLFIIYLLIEWVEQRASGTMHQALQRIEKSGPAVGSLLGIVPQCGLSAAAAELYTGGLLTIGTLAAVFLSTSDEMLPIFLSEQIPLTTILAILAAKAGIACISGFAVAAIWRFHSGNQNSVCGNQNRSNVYDPIKSSALQATSDRQSCRCGCAGGTRSIWRLILTAVWKTVKIALFIFLVMLVLNLLMSQVDTRLMADGFRAYAVGGVLLSALVGLIPSCASSVIITEFYIGHVISTGAMMAGLLMNSGVGLLVLLRAQRNWRKTLQIAAMLYGISVFWGLVIQLFGIG